jgi:hypothetical protein
MNLQRFPAYKSIFKKRDFSYLSLKSFLPEGFFLENELKIIFSNT